MRQIERESICWVEVWELCLNIANVVDYYLEQSDYDTSLNNMICCCLTMSCSLYITSTQNWLVIGVLLAL